MKEVSKKEQLLCALGMHLYEVEQRTAVKNAQGEETGLAFTSRCTRCGKIKTTYVAIKEELIYNIR